MRAKLLCKGHLAMALNQFSQHLIQSDLENLEGWRLHHVFGQFLPLLNSEKISHSCRWSSPV